ncbi:cleavage and polyadenylation specificity factor subunit 3, partial [Raphidocelis subcapitata]
MAQAKRRASQELEALEAAAADPAAVLKITPLGAGQEVGRSCIILEYMGKRVMLDCGIHPGFSGLASLPFLDEVDLDAVDAALITHFHLDHCAAVPYLVGRTNFKGRLLMTHPTRAIFHTLLSDFVRVSAGSADEGLYNESDLEAAMARAEVIDFDQTVDLGGIQVTAHRAGHVLGAAMFSVTIAGRTVLYTGDYSRVADRHLPGADTPATRPDVLIVESTYGVSRHLARAVREKRFLDKVTSTLIRGGKVLLPIVALGRAQELLLMLDEHWGRNRQLQGYPIYQAS